MSAVCRSGILAVAGLLASGVTAHAADGPQRAVLARQVHQLQHELADQRAGRDRLARQVQHLKQQSDQAQAETASKDRQIRALQQQLRALQHRAGSGG